MTFNEYQAATLKTSVYRETVSPHFGNNAFLYLVLGLVGESGEVADKIKKLFRDQGGVLSDEKKQELAKELGDVLWYLTRLAEEWGFTLEQIAEMNANKLQSRKQRDALHGDGDNR
ncbi:MAG: hypothetical protein RL141_1095 [Candidatus Parcubacteria bacterium]|jgi:NTP pyrophosphatase (non-canonical NTP hydrolase)